MKKTIFSFLILLILWQILVSSFSVNPILFPSPLDVISSLLDAKSLILDISISLFRLSVGAIIGILAGILYGLLTGHISRINAALGQITNFFRFIPPLALVPLFLLWFGIGEISKIGLLAWTCFFPVWISTHNGVRNIENKYVLVAKSLDIKGFSFLKEILLKGSMNSILNGARIGVGIAFSVLIAAEMIGAYSGLGYRIFFLQSVYRVDMMILYIIILGLLGLVFDRLFLLLSKKLTPWKDES